MAFQHFAARGPEAVAVVDPAGAEWTRGEFGELVNRLARAFMASGLSPGEAIAIISPNCAEYLATYLAGLQAGLGVVPVNWHLSESETEFILSDSGARAIVAHERLGEKRLASIKARRGAAELLISIGAVEGFVRLQAYAAAHTGAPLDGPPSGRMMAYTSATTGRPKAVRLPSANSQVALERIVQVNRFLGVYPDDDNVHLCASMLYHSAPLGGCEVALHMRHRVVLVDTWEPELLLRLIEKHRVTTTFMVPAMFVRLLKLPENVRRRYDTSSLRFVVHGGAPCPAETKRAMIEWWGGVIWESYGATEAQGTIVSAADWLRHPGTVGKPFPGAAITILDDEGQALPPFEIGLVYIKSHTGDRFEYKGDPEKTRSSYRGDFVTVGDLGYLDDEGYLFLCDRSTDVIISSGMNIYPAEIETVLVQHPLVTDCAVLGEHHPLLGEVPKAYVQLEPGVEPGPRVTADLLGFLRDRVSIMKLPKRFEYVGSVPRDPNGKLYRRLLREREEP